MLIIDATPVDLPTPENGFTYTSRLVISGDRVLMGVGYYNEGEIPAPGATLVVMDLASGDVSVSALDERCALPSTAIEAENGDVYFFSEADVSRVEHFDVAPNVTSCALRVKAGDDEFDPEYLEDVEKGTDDHPAGVAGLLGDALYVYVLDEDAPDFIPWTTSQILYPEYALNPAWKLHRMTFPGFTDLEPVADLPHGRCCGGIDKVDGRALLINIETPGGDEINAISTVLDVTDGAAVPTIRFERGQLGAPLRVR